MKSFKFKLTEDTGLLLEFNKPWHLAVKDFWKKFNHGTEQKAKKQGDV